MKEKRCLKGHSSAIKIPDIKVFGCDLDWWLIKVEQWFKQRVAVIEIESHLKRHSETNRCGVLTQLHFRKVIKA